MVDKVRPRRCFKTSITYAVQKGLQAVAVCTVVVVEDKREDGVCGLRVGNAMRP